MTDASHAPFLHRTLDNNASNLHLRIRESEGSMEDVMPRYVLEDTPYGNIFGAVRKQQDGHNYVSVTPDSAVLYHARGEPQSLADELPRAGGR